MLPLLTLSSILSLAAPIVTAWQCQPGSDAAQAVQSSCRTKLWDVKPLDFSDELYAGWPQLNISKRIVYHKGTDVNRTYSHHAMLLKVGTAIIVVHSSAVEDEDSMGQNVWAGVSHDGGYTWTKSQEVMPSALLPNQTEEHNFNYWCEQGIPQRSLAPESVILSPISGVPYVIAASSNYFCNDKNTTNKYTRNAGRIARPLNVTTGAPAGDPCWLRQNEYTYPLGYDQTVYGTKWNMQVCDEADILNEVIDWPGDGPAWARILNLGKLYMSDGKHDAQENTLAVYDPSSRIYQRFWRDTSGNSIQSYKLWTECTCNATSWYPASLPEQDSDVPMDEKYPIYETDINDGKTKAFFSSFSSAHTPNNRYLVSNPRNNTQNVRYPLTLAWQGEGDTDADWTFKNIGVVDTNPPSEIVPDSRKLKRRMFSYPNALQYEDHLVITYSQNKEDIIITLIDLDDLKGV